MGMAMNDLRYGSLGGETDLYPGTGITKLMVIVSLGDKDLLMNDSHKRTINSHSVNKQTNNGDTALHYALIDPNNKYMVSYLLENGANVYISNNEGVTPYDMIKNHAESDEWFQQLMLMLDKNREVIRSDDMNMFDLLPKDVRDTIIINYLSYDDFVNLCTTSDLFKNRYYENNGNSIIWITFFKNNISIKLPAFDEKKQIRDIYLELYNNLYNFHINLDNEWYNKMNDLKNKGAYKLIYKLFIDKKYKLMEYVKRKLIQSSCDGAIIANDMDFFIYVSEAYKKVHKFEYMSQSVAYYAIEHDNFDFMNKYIEIKLLQNTQEEKSNEKLLKDMLHSALLASIRYNKIKYFHEIVDRILTELNPDMSKKILTDGLIYSNSNHYMNPYMYNYILSKEVHI